MGCRATYITFHGLTIWTNRVLFSSEPLPGCPLALAIAFPLSATTSPEQYLFIFIIAQGCNVCIEAFSGETFTFTPTFTLPGKSLSEEASYTPGKFCSYMFSTCF